MLVIKNLPASAEDARNAGLIPGLGRSPGKRKWQPTPVFLPKTTHGQRSLEVYSLWGHKRAGPNLVTNQQQNGWEEVSKEVFFLVKCLWIKRNESVESNILVI